MKHTLNVVVSILALAWTTAAQPAATPAQTLKDNYYPRLVKAVVPELAPEVSQARGGFARLSIHVGADGHVTNVEVLDSTDGASTAVTAAVNQWIFEPLVKNGQRVASSVSLFMPLNHQSEDRLRAFVNASGETLLPPPEKLALLEEQSASLPDFERNLRLPTLAKTAFEAGRFGKASTYAQQCLDAVSSGDHVYDGNLIMGRLAVRDGNIEEAKRRLLAAAHTGGSPTLDSFGPNTSLAKDLLEKGERDTVLQFFQLCHTFWKDDRGQLDAWTAEVRAGKIPDFGANQVY